MENAIRRHNTDARQAAIVQAQNTEECSARVMRDVAELEAVRRVWCAFPCHPFVDMDFYLTVLRSRGPNVRPFVIALSQGSEVAGLLVARIEEAPREARFGYRRIVCGRMRRLIVPHGGCLGSWTGAMYQRAAEALMGCLTTREINLLELAGLPVGSPLRSTVERSIPRFCSLVKGPVQEHWKMSLPLPGEDPVKRLGKRARGNTARERRVFERNFGTQYEFRRYTSEVAVPELVDACEAIARTTYHRRLGFGFVANDEMRNRLALEARRGRLWAYILTIRGEPAAFWICTLSGQTLYLDYTGFAPEYRKYDVGKVSFLYLLEDIRDHTDARTADFGSGGGFLKQVFGDLAEQEESLYALSSAFRDIVWALAMRATGALDRSAKRLLRATGQIERTKRIWRNQAVSERSACVNGQDTAPGDASRYPG